jgi:MinD superfamily P-loop ATPase
MKQLVILSGKGGTGKTSLAAAFAHLSSDEGSRIRAVLADADVDAANLELVLRPQRQETHDFIGGSIAVIDPESCNHCDVCTQVCRFDAIYLTEGIDYSVDAIACDGCAACVYQCPENAIHMEEQLVGQWYRSSSRYGPLFHADLRPAQENSGRLVTLVKQNARLWALDNNYSLVIVDGPPGIGCPVISAAAGADLALIVTEPTAAGIHDMRRALETTSHFRIPTLVAINKADIFPSGSQQIEAFCRDRAIELVGKIPFDETVTEAMLKGEPVTAFHPKSPASREMAAVWRNVVNSLSIQK